MQFKHDLDPKKFKIGVVRAGGWGTALANLLASKGFENKTHLTMTGVLKETLAGIPVL
jgi:glycerol-3-phosphate dehydrogenase